jgi:hypothetical protein
MIFGAILSSVYAFQFRVVMQKNTVTDLKFSRYRFVISASSGGIGGTVQLSISGGFL